MILPNKKIKQENHASLTDWSVQCPEGHKSFYVFVYFEDGSNCILSNIFAKNRTHAFALVLQRFADCIPYMTGWNLHESDY